MCVASNGRAMPPSPDAVSPMTSARSTPRSIVITSPRFDDRRYLKNLRMFAKIARPTSTAATMVAKLSSASTMSAAVLDTSVPAIPMAIPMSAVFKAGASLTPSPVIATVSP